VFEKKECKEMSNTQEKWFEQLYSISRLISDPASAMDDYFNQTITILANAMHYPEKACGRIRLKNREYATQNFTETEWKQASDIIVNDEIIGCVEVHDRGKVITWTSDGSPLMMFGTHQDITQRKQAEQREKQTRRYLETILQTTADGFWVLDTKGILIDVNEAYCKMTGYTKEALIGMSIGDLDNIESPEVTAERIERIVVNGFEFFETWHRRRDGSIFPVEVSTTWLPIQGGRLVCFGRDITGRKQAEARILHLEKAESLGRMAGAVAHHYNNLLTIVMGNLEFLVTNAREAIGDKTGSVYLDIRKVCSTEISTAHRYPIDFQPGKTDYACMEVTDTGAGIPENDIDKIFEPFYSTKFIGRGLGLPVALGAVKTHNGCMTVSTKCGRGTSITVFLPTTDKTDQVL
jgi:PAS domain S-box-containing protein